MFRDFGVFIEMLVLFVYMASGLFQILALPLLLFVSILCLFFPARKQPRFVWGVDPIINIKYLSKALQRRFESKTVVFEVYGINNRNDFNDIFMGNVRIPYFIKSLLSHVKYIFWGDIFCFSFNGGFLGRLKILSRAEPYLYRIAGKKIVIWPYGSDSYVYGKVRDPSSQNCLMVSYPLYGRRFATVELRVNRWRRHADILLSHTMSLDGIGRWDVLTSSYLIIDKDQWASAQSATDKAKENIVICHSPNHRGAKGSEFIISAVQKLKDEGYPVELRLLEGVPNHEVKRVLTEEADILVEQLILQGHGLSALEGMASGLPVVSNISDVDCFKLFRRYSFFDECPLVSGTPENIVGVLRSLVSDANLRKELGEAGRQYVDKYHSYEMGLYVFEMIVRKIWFKEDVDLMNLFHPILGEYPKRKPKIKHPLVENRIVD